MTSEQLSECLRTLGWSARELARRVNRGERLIRRMCEGREEIPDNLADWGAVVRDYGSSTELA
jgi:hypothetical protein